MKSIGKNLLCSGFSRPFSTDGSFAYFDHRKRNVNVVRMCFLGLPGHTLLFRRELINMLPPLEHSIFKYSMYDAALSIVAAAHKNIVFIDKILVNFRRHSAATTYNDYKKKFAIVAECFIYVVVGNKALQGNTKAHTSHFRSKTIAFKLCKCK